MSKMLVTTGESRIVCVISPDETFGEMTVTMNFEPNKTIEEKKAIMDKLDEAVAEIIKEHN